MVRMQIRKGIRWPAGVDFTTIPTPGRGDFLGLPGKIMKLTRAGCRNRPFYHIEVTREHYPKIKGIPPIEQVGSYDPMPNEHGEKLCALNLERVAFYLSQGVKVSQDVSMLLGLAGFLPQNPHTYKTAWRNREELKYKEESEKYNSDAK